MLAGWLAGWVITARLLFVWEVRSDEDADGFTAVVFGLIWPLLLGVVVVLAPFVAVGWLITRPVRRR